ncbi:TPA: hypothetical protein H1902_004799 [Salmonella enterica]|nr:hypothetical protein [Salmonella enterica]HAK2582604.1 hypothetical protein [Salmonella enterica]
MITGPVLLTRRYFQYRQMLRIDILTPAVDIDPRDTGPGINDLLSQTEFTSLISNTILAD